MYASERAVGDRHINDQSSHFTWESRRRWRHQQIVVRAKPKVHFRLHHFRRFKIDVANDVHKWLTHDVAAQWAASAVWERVYQNFSRGRCDNLEKLPSTKLSNLADNTLCKQPEEGMPILVSPCHMAPRSAWEWDWCPGTIEDGKLPLYQPTESLGFRLRANPKFCMCLQDMPALLGHRQQVHLCKCNKNQKEGIAKCSGDTTQFAPTLHRMRLSTDEDSIFYVTSLHMEMNSSEVHTRAPQYNLGQITFHPIQISKELVNASLGTFKSQISSVAAHSTQPLMFCAMVCAGPFV